VFNAQSTVSRAVASIQAQDFTSWEAILIDDGSTDGSGTLCARLADADSRIRVLQQNRNTGAAAARNRGIADARGRLIAFLDADDEWLPTKLSQQIAYMKKTGAALCYSGFWRAREGRDNHRVQVPETVTRTELLRGNVIGCLTAIYDRDQLGSIQMPDMPLRQDFAFWLDILNRIPMAHGLNEPLAIHNRQPGSLTSSRRQVLLANWQLYRHHLGLGVATSARYMAYHLIRRLHRG
jgi:teichuronic acid biosynthesis glycosyltransferase TuaG